MSKQKSVDLSLRAASWFAILTILGLCFLPVAHAQSAGTASVQGTVTDPTGAAVPNAAIILTNTETHVARSTVTDNAGLYSLPNVAVGPYSLTVAASGFSGFTQKGVLEVGNNLEINPVLKIGAATESVEVQAAGVALETETSSFKQVIDSRRIVEMPLNGRDATQLILVAGGAVTAPAGDIVTSKNYYTSKVFAVAGSQGNYNNYVLDGGTNVDVFTNSNLPFPFPDALREFSVEANSLPARNGLHPGGLINGVTNSGTNQWHGTVFEFLRNNIINANNFFSTTKDSLKRSQFGGTFGGRIITDKLFFFGGYQGTRNNFVSNATGVCIPTPAELAGDFSHMGGNCPQTTANIIDPVSGANISATRRLPASSISPQALNLAKYLPIAQADQYGRVQVAIPANYTEDQYVGRVDYTFNEKHSIFGRYFLTNFNLPSYFSPTNLLVTTVAGNSQRVQNFTLGYTWIISPKLVNTFHGTYARRRNDRGPTAGGINANTIGVNMFLYAPVDLRLNVANNFAVGCGTCSPGFFNTQSEHFVDDIDWIHGKHQIAFGGEILRAGQNTQVGYLFNGNFNFGGASSGGEPMIDFIAGSMSNSGTNFAFGQSRTQQTTYRQTIFSLYAQDTYHFTPRLTANIGLRWEPMLFQVDKFGRGSNFNQAAFNANQHSTVFPNAPAGSFFYGDPGVPKSFTDNRYANLSPRVSLTLDPTGKGSTVFRAGGAIMYDNPGLYTTQRTTSNPPFVNEIDLNGPVPFAQPWRNYAGGDPFPGVFPPNATSTFPQGALWVIVPRHIQTPTVYQWTASVQQDLGRGWMFSLNYLGNHNAHLWLGRTPNPAVYIPGTWRGPGTCGPLTIAPATASNPTGIGNPCSSTSNTNTRTVLSLTNPTQGQLYSSQMTIVDDGANTSYNGLIAAVQKRMSGNFSFLANYTWSHCLAPNDSPGDVTGPSYSQAFNPRADRGPCGYDVRHIFNTTIIAASHFSSLHGWAGALANNWQIAPLLRMTSGLPLNITSGTDNSLTGQNLDRPNFIGLSPDAAYTHKKITQSAAGNRAYFNRTAFTQNAPGTFGNVGRNAFRGPNSYTLDVAVSRSFPLYERLAFILRLEAFNVLNHPNFPNFALPPSNAAAFTTALNSGTFGYINAAADPRIFQLAGKFTF